MSRAPQAIWSQLHQLVLASAPVQQQARRPASRDTLNLSRTLAGGFPAPSRRLPVPQSYFMSQVYDATFNPQAPSSTANCGPTSLAMALVAFGKAPASTDPENLIEQVRIRMTGQDDLNQLTSESQVASAARSYGLKTNLVNSAAEVCDAVNAGNLVILAGNPAAYNKGLSPSQYMAFDGGHFVLVTGTVGDDVLINDPLSHVGTLRISRDQLARFMAYQGWNSGVAVQG